MKIGFYSPYLDTLGGGERYLLTLAAHWSQKDQVEVFWDDPGLKEKMKKRFGLDLEKVTFSPNLFSPRTSFANRLPLSHAEPSAGLGSPNHSNAW